MEFDVDNLSKALIKIRDSRGFKQSFLAQKLGISQKAYSYIESGRCKMEFFRFLIISKITETHPMEIINNIVPKDTLWSNKVVCFNHKDCQLQKTIEELETENRILRTSLERILSFDK